jgi:hypothetical protein
MDVELIQLLKWTLDTNEVADLLGILYEYRRNLDKASASYPIVSKYIDHLEVGI